MQLYHVIGDATAPVNKPTIIAHVCNDIGAFGAGFVLPLGKAYPQAKQDYLDLPKSRLTLGSTQFVDVAPDITVANMIAQRGIRPSKGVIPLRYDSLHTCLEEVQERALARGYSVSMPRIGAGLAGGSWSVIKSVIMASMKVDTYVYTLASEADKWPETRKDQTP